MQRNYVMSIAGFDPSAGAGVLSDIKTFESLGLCGLGVCSAITAQTENTFRKVSWVSPDVITQQAELLLEKYPVSFIKIGLIENLDVLGTIIGRLKSKFKKINFIWDPILSASAGYIFHQSINKKQVNTISENIFLVTPNANEIKVMMQNDNSLHGARELASFTSVFLKSYIDRDGFKGDLLIESGDEMFLKNREEISSRKHGSGCVLSAAIAAYLANGNNLSMSCTLGKDYVTAFLKSAEGLLGSHSNIKLSISHA